MPQLGTAAWQCQYSQTLRARRCCTNGVLDAGGFCCDSGALDDCGVCDGDSQSCALHVVLTTTVRGGSYAVASRGAEEQRICMTGAVMQMCHRICTAADRENCRADHLVEGFW